MPSWRSLLVHTLVTFAGLTAASLWVARDRTAAVSDLPQDYASARAWLDGDSPYLPLGTLLVRYGFPPPPADVMVGTNPHPPVAVLLTAPYALSDFETALAAVRWTQLAALALTWALCFEMFRPPVPGLVWALLGGAFGLWAPVWQGLAWGQPVGLLALGTVGIWALARSEKPFAFGLALSAVTLVRPFTAIHVVLLCGWNARQQARAIAGLAVGGLVPFALLGITPWDWYRLASDAGGYVSGCGSLPGVLEIGPKGGQLLYAAATLVLALLCWRGCGVDAVVALAAVTAMLAYPLAWFQYDVSLVPVVAWVAARVAATGNRAALWCLVAYLLMRTVPDMIPTPGGTGLVELLARYKGCVQVLARTLLLVAVVAAAKPQAASQAGRLSASGPS
jgi:hypothetical protein